MTAPTVDALRQGGIANPLRLAALIRQAIAFLELDLTGLTVLTEAASGAYVVTPVVAALAGAARVLAVTADSAHANCATVAAQTRALELLVGLDRPVEIRAQRSVDLFAQADIVTNLGFVRPIDASAVAAMKTTAVVPLMCEGWELRPEDVNVGACLARGIPVAGTDEGYAGLDVFDYSGWLCLKMLMDAQVEVHRSTIVVVGGDAFGATIADRLARCGVCVRLLPDLGAAGRVALVGADALVVADYLRTDPIVGPDGDITAAELASLATGITVIQFAGRVDVGALQAAGVPVWPGRDLTPRRMALTLAALGPRPVVDLHAAGLKVGELLARERLSGAPCPPGTEIRLRGARLGQVVAASAATGL